MSIVFKNYSFYLVFVCGLSSICLSRVGYGTDEKLKGVELRRKERVGEGKRERGRYGE